MKLYTPKRTMTKTSIGKAKLSSHVAKAPHMSMGKVNIKAPKIGSKRSVGKVKI